MSKSRTKLRRTPCAPATETANEQMNAQNMPAAQGFIGMIPRTLSEVVVDWESCWPEILKHFPADILFLSGDGQRSVLYEPDFETFSDDAGTASLTYRTVRPSDFRVDVFMKRSSATIETWKYKGEDLVRFAHGADFKRAMFLTTMHGVEPGEPFEVDLVQPGTNETEHLSEAKVPASDRALAPDDSTRHLVYGILRKGHTDDNLVFIPECEAKRLSAIHSAIATADSWIDFCRKMPERDLAYVVQVNRDWGRDLPAQRDDFDCYCVLPPSYFDGDWPGWPEQLMMNWLPRELWFEYGTVHGSAINGDFLTFDVNRTDEIVQALQRRGYKLRCDERLITIASGYSLPCEEA